MAQASKTNRILSAVAGVAFTTAAMLAPSAASAQDKIAAAPSDPIITGTVSGQVVGKHVTLRLGRDFDNIDAAGVADVLRAEGCTAEVTTEKALPRHLGVEVGENKFRSKSPASVTNMALEWCLPERDQS